VAVERRRGRGSNQYQDRLVDVTVEERERERQEHQRALDGRVAPAEAAGTGATSLNPGTLPFGEVLVSHRQAVVDHLDYLLDPDSAKDEAGVRAGMQRIAAFEDDILHRQPNLYGHALIQANRVVARLAHDPVFRLAYEAGDESATRVVKAAHDLVNDADRPHLGLEGISLAIVELEGGGEWLVTDDPTSSVADSQEDLLMAARSAALRVESSRTSDPDERERLQQELEATQQQWRQTRLRALG